MEARLRPKVSGGNLLRDIFDGEPRFFQLRIATAG